MVVQDFLSWIFNTGFDPIVNPLFSIIIASVLFVIGEIGLVFYPEQFDMDTFGIFILANMVLATISVVATVICWLVLLTPGTFVVIGLFVLLKIGLWKIAKQRLGRDKKDV